MKRLVLSLVLASGCAGAWSEAVPGPNGLAYSVTCRRGVENCYREAAKVCGGGQYQVLDVRESRPAGLVATSPTSTTMIYSPAGMLVQCKAATSNATASR